MTNSVAIRVQDLEEVDQTLVLADVANRRTDTGRVSPRDIEDLFHALALPAPAYVSNKLSALEKRGLVSRTRGAGSVWALSPRGRQRVSAVITDLDLTALEAMVTESPSWAFAHTAHPVIPPTLAPPGIARPVLDFIDSHPFDLNVFAMTRFPAEVDTDRLSDALAAARDACSSRGLNLLLASEQAIVEDLWQNVSAHMWASRYGIAFFEDRADKGLNHNMTIEVGAMLMAGRRCALLKDRTIKQMPTDLVGKIYKSVDIGNPETVERAIDNWIESDLRR